jgi:diguanylate cyclase (GGDEF)-like protein
MLQTLKLDFQTTLLFATILTVLFTATVALLWQVLHKEGAYRRLLAWNVLVLASQLLRLATGEQDAPWVFAVYWSLLMCANAAYCGAALLMIDKPQYERALYAVCGALLLVLWILATVAVSRQPMGALVGLISAALYVVTAIAVYRLIGERHSVVRAVVTAPFVLAATLAMWFAAQRLADLLSGVVVVQRQAVSHLFGEIVFICANLSVLLWLFLRQERKILHLARTDALTGALNRRGLQEALGGVRQGLTSGDVDDECAIVMMDIDHFKRINDSHGHRAGDEVLRQFSQLVLQRKRPGDLFARLGGEEYCLLMPHASVKDAVHWANALRDSLRAQALPVADGMPQLQVTASFGVASLKAASADWQHAIDDALMRADDALYAAKAGGRDRVVLST